jgi:2-dehydropantoate 2-reductase
VGARVTTDAYESWAEGARAIVVGCGGVGGCVLARLADSERSGRHRGLLRHVVGVAGNVDIANAIVARGVRAKLADGERTVRVDVVASASELSSYAASNGFDFAFLSVPPNRLEAAAESVMPFLGGVSGHGYLVTLSNGLPEERLAARFGAERIIGGIVGFGASMLAPGVVEQTSDGGLTLGRLDGVIDEATRRCATFLSAVDDDVEITSNLRGARWSKLAINCAISSLGTIGGDRVGALMRHRFVRRLCLEVMTEATQVAMALGVKLEKIAGTLDLEWMALDDDERMAPGSPGLLAKHTVLLAVGAKYRRLRSSMLQAIERGREPPVDFLNGEIVARAPELNARVPVNAAVVEVVKAIGRRERASSLEELRRLFDDTRPILKSMSLAA